MKVRRDLLRRRDRERRIEIADKMEKVSEKNGGKRQNKLERESREGEKESN